MLLFFQDLYVHHVKMPQTVDVGMINVKNRKKRMHKLQKDLETDLNGSVHVNQVREDIMTENGN